MSDSMAQLHGWNSAPTGPLVAGPLLGEVSPTEARIWVQARSSAPISLLIYREDISTSPVQVIEQTPQAAQWLCSVFEVASLEAGVAYSYSFRSEHGESERIPLHLGVAEDATTLRIAFGSCYKEYSRHDLRIFDSIAASSPDLFLMLGDTCYTDEEDRRSEATFMQAHLRNRNSDALRRVISRIPTLGIWDDHDFGPNDKDGRYSEKDRSLRCFCRMWAQKQYGTESLPGVFSRVRCGPVELFLLDSRFYRREREHILGDGQLQWLLEGLKQSTAPVKLLLSGSQVLPEVAARSDWDWECFRRDGAKELERLQSFLAEQDISGVVALSGDPHLGQIFRAPGVPRGDRQIGPPLWELTSSPLANRPWTKPVWPADSQGEHSFDRYLLEEVAAPNFGLVDIDLSRVGAEVRLHLCQEDGATFFSYDLDLETLRVRPHREHVCAAVRDARHAYCFVGDKYARYDIQHGTLDEGFPRAIKDGWKGVFPGQLSAVIGIDAVYFSKRGKAFFFSGNGYVRFDLEHDQVDPGYPKYLKTHWHGVWAADLTAILPGEDDKIIFVKGTECIRYDLKADRADLGYPRPLADEFPGIFAEEIDAAVAWSDGSYYFVCGNEVMRFDSSTRQLLPGYPRRLSEDPNHRWFAFLT